MADCPLSGFILIEIRISFFLHLINATFYYKITLRKKRYYIHQVTTTPTTSKNVQFPSHNHLLITGTDDLTLW